MQELAISNNVEIFSIDDQGLAKKMWSHNLKSDNLDSFFNAVQIKTDEIVLFAKKGLGNDQGIGHYGIFNKYTGKTIQSFRAY